MEQRLRKLECKVNLLLSLMLRSLDINGSEKAQSIYIDTIAQLEKIERE